VATPLLTGLDKVNVDIADAAQIGPCRRASPWADKHALRCAHEVCPTKVLRFDSLKLN
jgi:hypothetical protein